MQVRLRQRLANKELSQAPVALALLAAEIARHNVMIQSLKETTWFLDIDSRAGWNESFRTLGEQKHSTRSVPNLLNGAADSGHERMIKYTAATTR